MRNQSHAPSDIDGNVLKGVLKECIDKLSCIGSMERCVLQKFVSMTNASANEDKDLRIYS